MVHTYPKEYGCIYIYGIVHTSVLKFPLKPRETRRLYESWRLLTYICIILCIFLGPRKRLLLYLHHFIMYLSGTAEEVTYICIILCIFLGPRKRLLIFSSFYVFSGTPEKSDIESRIIERTVCKINYRTRKLIIEENW